MQLSRLNHISAASGVAYRQTYGAIIALNLDGSWTEIQRWTAMQPTTAGGNGVEPTPMLLGLSSFRPFRPITIISDGSSKPKPCPGAAAVAPEFVREKERLRYERQAGLIKLLEEKGALRPELNATAAGDILWTLTSYDIHRRLVMERKWSADHYEQWLGDTLVRTLLKSKEFKLG